MKASVPQGFPASSSGSHLSRPPVHYGYEDAPYLLLVSCVAFVPLFGQAAASQASASQRTATSATATPDLALRELLIQVQAIAQKSDQDVARLRIDKWKADAASKQQAETTAFHPRNRRMQFPICCSGSKPHPAL